MLHRHFIGLAAAFGIVFMSGNVTLAKDLVYPVVERGDVIDNYHGVSIADPYRCLENPESPATREFVQRQNAFAEPLLEALPQRPWIRSRLEALWNYERVGVPRKQGGHSFFVRNAGRQNQGVLFVADSLRATPRV